jgi:GT2 family glycosyltransferase
MRDSGGNIGFGRACNLAFAQSNADFLLLLNPDARVAPDAVRAMALVMAQRPGLGALSPAVYWNAQHSFVLPVPSAQSPAQVCGVALRTHWQGVARFAARQAVRKTQADMARPALLPVSVLAGAVMLVRRSAVLAAGGLFDPAYFMFFEDADLSLRLRRKGYGLAIAPEFRAVHEYRHKAFKAEAMAQSQAHYFASNFPRFYRNGKTLRQLQRWHCGMPLHEWFEVLEGAITSAEDLAQRTGGQGVVAWSPSLLMAPAICRPAGDAARPLDAAEWALLELGGYVVWLEDQAGHRPTRWTYFDKT